MNLLFKEKHYHGKNRVCRIDESYFWQGEPVIVTMIDTTHFGENLLKKKANQYFNRNTAMYILAFFLKKIIAFKKYVLIIVTMICSDNMLSLSGDSVSYFTTGISFEFLCQALLYLKSKWSLAGVIQEKHSEVSSRYSEYSFCSSIPIMAA